MNTVHGCLQFLLCKHLNQHVLHMHGMFFRAYEENKNKPQKLSGLAARLQAMQEQQKELQRQREELQRKKNMLGK